MSVFTGGRATPALQRVGQVASKRVFDAAWATFDASTHDNDAEIAAAIAQGVVDGLLQFLTSGPATDGEITELLTGSIQSLLPQIRAAEIGEPSVRQH